MMTDPMQTKLRPNCLNFIELLVQNIALISPTMTRQALPRRPRQQEMGES